MPTEEKRATRIAAWAELVRNILSKSSENRLFYLEAVRTFPDAGWHAPCGCPYQNHNPLSRETMDLQIESRNVDMAPRWKTEIEERMQSLRVGHDDLIHGRVTLTKNLHHKKDARVA